MHYQINISSSKSYLGESSWEFKSILDINIVTQLEYSISKFWLNLNTWFQNSDLNQVLTSRELDLISMIQLDAISLIFVLTSNFLNSKIIIFVTVVSTIFSSFSLSFLYESMNLSFIIVIIQDKTLIISEIKKICNKWKFYYYCKLQHSSKIVKECSNKKLFTLCIMNVYDSDVININEEISLFAKKV